jgi:hypothetical protein
VTECVAFVACLGFAGDATFAEDAIVLRRDRSLTGLCSDPRKWSRKLKHLILFIIAWAAMGGAMTANIFFPALQSLQQDLRISDHFVTATVGMSLPEPLVLSEQWSL